MICTEVLTLMIFTMLGVEIIKDLYKLSIWTINKFSDNVEDKDKEKNKQGGSSYPNLVCWYQIDVGVYLWQRYLLD